MKKALASGHISSQLQEDPPAPAYKTHIHGERVTVPDGKEFKMPVGVGTDTATLSVPHSHTPTGELNGGDIQDTATDVEDLYSEGDQSPLLNRKALLAPHVVDTGALTDTEDMDLSGEEDDIIPEKKDMPTVQELGLLPEPVREVVNLTEGYAREASPVMAVESDQEEDETDIIGRHKKNMEKVDHKNQLELPGDDDPDGMTDMEDMVASGEEEEIAEEVEDSLPDHYLDQAEGISDSAKMKPPPMPPKIFLIKEEESTDDESANKKLGQSKHKAGLRVEARESGGTTDVEELALSDKGEGKQKVEIENTETKKLRRKKVVKRKVPPKKPASTGSSKTLGAPAAEDEDGHTDVEVLTGDESQATPEDGDALTLPEEDLGPLTDSEDVEASDAEEVDDILTKPLDKKEPLVFPEPQRERIKIKEVEEPAKDESGAETDEEGFELQDQEDQRPLNPRQTVVHEPLVTVAREALEAEEPSEPVLTDTEDMDMEDREENEMVEEMMSRVPEETEIYTIKELDENMGKISKKEMVLNTDAELMKKIKEAEARGLTIQQVMEEEAVTDVEDLDDETGGSKTKISKAVKTKKIKKEGETDEESVTESDVEDEIRKPKKQTTKRGKRRLPVVPQLSEVRFVETEQGPLSIIVTPESLENRAGKTPEDQVANVVFLETDDRDEDKTDVEELSGEEVEIIPSEIDRPRSPLPPHLKYNVLQSPKRELVHIKEDKYGVPQVSVRKLRKDELFVSDIEDTGATDTEDIEVSEEEALRLVGATEDSTAEYELPENSTTEISSKTSHGSKLALKETEDGGTDVEEIIISKKPRHKAKGRSKLALDPQGEDSHTDIELLSDQDEKTQLAVRGATPGAHTDVEDFEASEGEEANEAAREDAPTPDIIRDSAIRKTIIFKEGPHGTIYTEDAHVAPKTTTLLGVEAEGGGTTDVEDYEVSGAEDELPEHPPVELPEQESSSVDISERTNAPASRNEARQVKDNLLLPEENLNSVTDVESLGDGEGNRDP